MSRFAWRELLLPIDSEFAEVGPFDPFFVDEGGSEAVVDFCAEF